MAAAGNSGASPFALVDVDDPDPDDELELLLSDPEPLLDEDDGSKGVAVVVLDPSPSGSSPPHADRAPTAKVMAASRAAGRRTAFT
ncbi:hypothetical protein DUHN55_39040 [Helicobacter pylori]